MVYSKTKEIDEHLAEVLLGYVKLEGTVTRMDGSKCFWFTDRDGKQHKYATPRPNGEETLKKRCYGDNNYRRVYQLWGL